MAQILKNFAYCCNELSIHDNRIINALRNRFEVDLFKITETWTQKREKYSGIIATPLSIDLSKQFLKAEKIILLSMGYDLNEFVNVESLRILMTSNTLKADLVVVDNHELEIPLIESLGYKGKVFVLPYGCEIKQFTSIPSPNRQNLGTNRSFSQIHNNTLILDVVARLNPDLYGKFVFVTHGPHHENILKENRKNLDRIKYEFLAGGELDVTKKFLGEIDIFISASRSDGSSVSLLEAMAARKVCLVTNTPTNRYWIRDGVNGFCFDNHPDDLLNKIEKALTMTKSEKEEMVAKARSKVEREADWVKNSKEFCDLLDAIT